MTVRRVCLSAAVSGWRLTSVAACGGIGDATGSGDQAAPSRARPDRGAAQCCSEKTTAAPSSARIEATTAMGTMMSMKRTGAMGWSDGLTGTMDDHVHRRHHGR